MPTNRAAWQDKAGVKLEIRASPYQTTLAPTQILVRCYAWAINPADYMIQDSDALPFITYPLVLGEDLAGTVVSFGSAVTRFKAGDRVLAGCMGSAVGEPRMGGFQDYAIVDASMTCHIPDSMSFAEASVFPLGVITPSLGLFHEAFLGLPNPQVEPTTTGKSILIWGGSSSLGSNAIQLAKAAGFEVIATASRRNFENVTTLGASQVYDYTSDTVVTDIVAELDRSECAGIFHAAGSVEPSLEISSRAKSDLFVASSTLVPKDKVPSGVRAKMVFGTDLLTNNNLGPVFEIFLPQALAQGKYRIAPEPCILETKGLEGIQNGLDILRGGVSAKKVVVVAE